MLINLIVLFAGLLVGAAGSAVVLKNRNLFDFDKRKKQAEEEVARAKSEAEDFIKHAKERALIQKRSIDDEVAATENRLNKLDESLRNRQSLVDKKEAKVNAKKLEIAKLEEEIQEKQNKNKKAEHEFTAKLAEKTGQDTTKVKQEILDRYKKELSVGQEERLALEEERLKENAHRTAQKVLQDVMQRITTATSVESKAVMVKVPKDFIKGKIVGKDAENIIELERIFDEVDIVFNDLPNTISISCYHLVKRAIAEKAIKKLVNHRGNITKEVIQKAAQEAEKEFDKDLIELGKECVAKMGLKTSNQELLKTIGRLQYRTSYGQNIMKHSMEVAWVATMLGSEIGLNIKTCKIGGLLHDLGKAIDQDPGIDDPHDLLTKKLMEKYGFSPEEVHAAWTHHEAEPPSTPEALIVMAADAVSASRPGARQESLGQYSERMRALEETGQAFAGVQKAFAISAGRELRIMVVPEEVKDGSMPDLAEKIAKQIEDTLAYPGKIKVNVIRRTDYLEVAN